jgi:predicted kinase
MSLSPLLEPPPVGEGRIPWDALQVFPWVRALADCPQDPIHHAEGDVGIHTRMVLETLVGLPAWQALPEEGRRAVYLASLLHDVAKPATTRTEPDGRVTAKGHSRRGELMARSLLYEMGAPFALREEVCGLIRYHQIPFYMIDRDDAQRVAAEVSWRCRADWLALVAEADIRGRHCADADRIVQQIALFVEFCREEGCLDQPRPFPTAHTRVQYFRSTDRSPEVEAYDDTRGEVIVMAGLPGAGKDTLIRTRYPSLPVISLDDLRAELDIDHADNQGPIVQAARERAKTHLRRGEPFVWNATNLNRQFRQNLLTLLHDYHARIKIVYVEVPQATLFAQNKARAAVVPTKVLERMFDRMELPDAGEVHEMEFAIR